MLFFNNGGYFLFNDEINNFAVPDTRPGPWTEDGLTETNSKFLLYLNASTSASNLDFS